MNIRQKINQLQISEDDRLLQEHGIISDHNNLTALGRRVVLDMLFDNAMKAKVVALVKEAVETDTETE